MNSLKIRPKLVFATNNQHKFEEIRLILGGSINLVSLSEIGCHEAIPEERETLEDNAAQKAFYVYDNYGVDCFADDTGLEIEALHGAPGVYSARYAGEKCDFEDNMNKVLMQMSEMVNRNARFRTVIALVQSGRLFTFEGIIKGTISYEKRGKLGFGYDPVFIPEGYDMTFAEMPMGKKNEISHRAIAITAFARHFQQSRDLTDK